MGHQKLFVFEQKKHRDRHQDQINQQTEQRKHLGKCAFEQGCTEVAQLLGAFIDHTADLLLGNKLGKRL